MSSRLTRRAVLGTLGAGAVTLAGCSGRSGGSGGGSGNQADTDTTETAGSGSGDGTTTGSAGTGSLPPVADVTLPMPMDPETLKDTKTVSGGVPKDGIPSIDEPSFISQNPDWLADDAFVFGVVRNGQAKAYPRRILAHHEIVNDTLAGDPVSVTYCPLTGTALGFERGDTTFGVSGRLVNNNLIMYDRATETWWPQVLSTGIPGFDGADAGVGQTLQQFRVVWTTWGAWKKRYPDTKLLSRDTGFVRSYDADPYGSYLPERSGYYSPDSSPMFPMLNRNDQFPAKRVFMAARGPEGALAVRKGLLRKDHLVTGKLGGTPHLAVHDPELDTGYLYRNPDGATFEWQDGQVLDPDGTAHAPAEVPLESASVPWFDAMWFAYAGFYPEGGVRG